VRHSTATKTDKVEFEGAARAAPFSFVKAWLIASQYRHKAEQGQLECSLTDNVFCKEVFVVRRLLVPAIFSAIALSILCGLGVWQLQRLYEKEALLKRIDQSLKADPVAMPFESEWLALKPDDYSYRKITVSGEFDHKHEAHFFGFIITDSRGGSAPGYFVLTPLTLQDGSRVIVNRGFVPEALKEKEQRALGLIEGPVTIQGLMRVPERRGLFTPTDDLKKNIRFLRDPAAIIASFGLERVAPFIVDADATPVPGRWPEGGHTVVSVPNNHLEYALTWFGLALVLVGVFTAFVLKARKA